MPTEFLLTRLLRDKQQRDAALAREDELLARRDAIDTRNFNANEEHRRFIEENDARRTKLAEDAAARSAESAAFDRKLTMLGALTNPNVRSYGSLGDLTANTMQQGRNAGPTGPVIDFGEFGYAQPLTQAERTARDTAAEDAAFRRSAERTRELATLGQSIAPAGARVSTVNPSSGSMTFASVPQPPRPPQPTRGEVTDKRAADAFAAIQEARTQRGGSVVKNYSDSELQQMAAAYAQEVGNPDLTLTILKMLRDQQRNERYADGNGSAGGGVSPLVQQYLRNRGGGGAPPLP